MLNLLLDENLRSGALWQAILARREAAHLVGLTDIVRVGDIEAPPLGTDDQEILEASATAGRILVSVDRSTLPGLFVKFLQAGNRSPGLIILRNGLAIPDAAELLLTISYAADAAEFADQCQWVP